MCLTEITKRFEDGQGIGYKVFRKAHVARCLSPGQAETISLYFSPHFTGKGSILGETVEADPPLIKAEAPTDWLEGRGQPPEKYEAGFHLLKTFGAAQTYVDFCQKWDSSRYPNLNSEFAIVQVKYENLVCLGKQDLSRWLDDFNFQHATVIVAKKITLLMEVTKPKSKKRKRQLC